MRKKIGMGISIIILGMICLTGGAVLQASCAADQPAFAKMRPKQDATVSITNAKAEKYWKNFEKGDGKKELKETIEKGRSRNQVSAEAVRLSWSFKPKKAGKTRYRVYIGEGPEMKKKKTIDTSKQYVDVKRLKRATGYYWTVSARIAGKKVAESGTMHFTTRDVARIVNIGGVANFRDLGGYKTSAGKRTKQGMLYRCASMDDVSKKGKKVLKKSLKIKTELDLRKPGEGKAGKSAAGLKYRRISGVMYEKVWSKDYTDRFISEMKVLAKSGNYPVVFHCAAGKDRTGTLAFMVNGMLGVSLKDLRRDYELTYLTSKSGTSKNSLEYIERFDKLVKYMRGYKSEKLTLQENITAFLLDHGMTTKELDSIRKIMME